MQMEEVNELADKVEYINYQTLNNPEMAHISDSHIQLGFQSKEWTIQFQTVTTLRKANKHCSATFISELLPKFYKQIIAQVENLRSNNSKEALTLLTEMFTHQQLNKISSNIIRPIINTLFVKSVSEKGFLKSEALKAIALIPNIKSSHVTEELMNLTKSLNASISELAIKTVNLMLEKNCSTEVSQQFLKDLSFNINGKRTVVQKQAKQILGGLKKRVGQEKLETIIDNANELDPQETNTLKRQLKKTESVASKGANFRDFMKMKKTQSTSTS